MTHLGNLGTPRESTSVTFDYFGEEIQGNPYLTDLDYLDFMEQASGLTPEDPKSLQLVKDFARVCLADGEFDRFWRLAKRNRQTQVDVYATLMQVLEASTGRPTESPSDSSGGPRDIEPRSTGDSSSVEARLRGRPDLQLIVKQAQEARAS